MQIPLQEVPSTPALVRDYLNDKESLRKLYTRPFSVANIKPQTQQKIAEYKYRDVLSKELERQMYSLELSVNQQDNLKRIKNQNTVTITTGHQLNLFTGPLYFMYKITEVIKTANELNAYQKDYHYIPIFWMASEDHDFDEINHCYINQQKVSWHTDQKGAVGRFKLDGIKEPIQDFLRYLHKTQYFDSVQEIIETSYQEGITLAEATRRIVHLLFQDQGVLILDADNRNLKSLMIPYFKRELLEESLFESSQSTLKFLKENSYKIQVNPREINLFYLTENSRNRILRQGENFHILQSDLVFTKDEIIQELESYPERFSPNAILRPLYQEVILPNVLYIGGNAEIAYWLELKANFEYNQVLFPLLKPRNSIVYLTEIQKNKIQKLGLQPQNLLLPLDQLQKKVIQKFSTIDLDLPQKTKDLEKIYQDLIQKSKKTDITLENLLKAEMKKQLNSFSKIEKRLYKAEKRVLSAKMAQFQSLYQTIYPGGVFQERRDNYFQFYQDFGPNFETNMYETISYQNSSLNIQDI